VLYWALLGVVKSKHAPSNALNDSSVDEGLSYDYRFSAFAVVFYAFLQFPIHLYSLISLRMTNNLFLEDDLGSDWGFGQVVAVVMSGATLVECAKGCKG
jgi:hypothetical protein